MSEFLKRTFDFTVSLILLILLSPIIFITAILVRICIGSPVFFKQIRPGLYGKLFLLYKFRSMTNKQDTKGLLLPDNIRVTRFGAIIRRFSIDELPQLWNILRGDMSFVGPRPLLEEYLPLYSQKQSLRHNVLPGITGWAQINGRNTISWEKKFELDVWYVEHHTFWIDIKIILLTLLKVIKPEGIHQNGFVNSLKFKGEIHTSSEVLTIELDSKKVKKED